jgi:hypothetical protein
MTDISSIDRSFSLNCSVKTAHPICPRVTVAGFARGRAIEIAPQTFTLVPLYLEDYRGLHVRWNEPAPGQPIWTGKHIVSCIEAQRYFARWAQRTFEAMWATNCEHPSGYGVRP